MLDCKCIACEKDVLVESQKLTRPSVGWVFIYVEEQEDESYVGEYLKHLNVTLKIYLKDKMSGFVVVFFISEGQAFGVLTN